MIFAHHHVESLMVTESTVDFLCTAAKEYMEALAFRTQAFAELACRSEANVSDIGRAFVHHGEHKCFQ